MTDAIRKLREAVEAGTATGEEFMVAGYPGVGWEGESEMRAYRAYHGSLDAALALMKAVLPGWITYEASENSRSMGWTWVICSPEGRYATSHYGFKGRIDTPARALLLAILKALEAQDG